ncbi:TPA: DUF1919 domain-containing protein [Streptococcus suis]|uniref:DUF1919 domain-containing protein n=1 Tax=Streptococcus suis TaxID=1307 RepID=UPI001554F2DD|nr:DUF1919 domain-containing protein [Streptococcus suis]MCK3972694.1 DUF1919 domain-containing protein [Streptococcus suis]MDW8732234.1 DUF1919 domain-containing protein [Streptococcus suis]NQQ72694.1 DUF1919 domain-containing protein [Streptococcus suis]HEL1702560.1 DUF1919 domain-containing protein [Streptococcus suis]HEL1709336.1 DUF1919 domain-containing protein [Streptococcus suis]
MNSIVAVYRSMLRYPIEFSKRKRLKNESFTIFSSNCIGGIIYNTLGKEFLTPTINMFFSPEDFIKFLKNPKEYLSKELINLESIDFAYPLAQCGDIVLHGVHYSNFDELKNSWDRRKERINWENIFIIMVERDGCTSQDILEFDSLPYENKVIFVSKPMPEINSACYLEGTEEYVDNVRQVSSLTRYKSRLTSFRYIDDFDYVSFLNEEV